MPAARQGVVALEFALVAPVFFLLLFAVLSAGVGGFYQFSLDDSVRDAARRMQLFGPASSAAGFVAAVCNEFALLAPDCAAHLTYAVQANPSTASFASLVPVAVPASGSLPDTFPGTLPANSNVLVQVAYPLPFTLPLIGTALTLTGTNSILSTTTVRMEPYG